MPELSWESNAMYQSAWAQVLPSYLIQFPANVNHGGASNPALNAWDLKNHIQDLDEVLTCWFWHAQPPPSAGLWGIKREQTSRQNILLFLYLLLCHTAFEGEKKKLNNKHKRKMASTALGVIVLMVYQEAGQPWKAQPPTADYIQPLDTWNVTLWSEWMWKAHVICANYMLEFKDIA